MGILVFGNCHAQYLGAALASLPGAEVQVVGNAYIGPVHFNWTLPRMISPEEGRNWKGDLVLMQVTNNDRWMVMQPPSSVETVLFPYFERRAQFGLAERFDQAKTFARAGFDPGPIEAALQTPGAVMHYNKFSGAVLAEVLQGLTPALQTHLSATALAGLVGRMKADRGLAFDPHPSLLGPHATGELAEQTEWVEALQEHRNTGSPAMLRRCISLYRPRLFTIWALRLIDALMARRKARLATILLCSRMAYEDARGRVFAHALRYSLTIRESYDAYRVLEEAAQQHPDTNLPLLFECVRRLG